MKDCDFRDVSDIPTIFNSTIILGEAVGIIDMDAVNKFSNRNIFNISYRWSREISRQKNC